MSVTLAYSTSGGKGNRLRQMKEGATSRFTALYDGGGLRVNKNDFWTGNHDFSWGPGGTVQDSNGRETVYARGRRSDRGAADRFEGDRCTAGRKGQHRCEKGKLLRSH